MAKSVKVHDDTHASLKRLKTSERAKSVDEVIRKMIEETTGKAPGRDEESPSVRKLTSYVEPVAR